MTKKTEIYRKFWEIWPFQFHLINQLKYALLRQKFHENVIYLTDLGVVGSNPDWTQIFFLLFFYIYLFYSMLYDIIKRSYKRWFFNFKENMISRGIFLVISCGEKGKASYLLIFSTDFIFFAQSSFSIPHKWQKDTFWALAHFLARFLSISAVCITSILTVFSDGFPFW